MALIFPHRKDDTEQGMNEKLIQLRESLAAMGSLVVAYSGGVDSTFLIKVAHDVLGDAAIAVTADSASMPRDELRQAQALASEIGVQHVCLATAELNDPRYLANTSERCYFCKHHTFGALVDYAREHGYACVADGMNVDDLQDRRPGLRAAQEHQVSHPLQEVGLTKAEIRQLARELGLPNWDKPAAACLSSRIPYGDVVTIDKLGQIEQAERYLRQQGFNQLRVRYHGQVARLELEAADFPRAVELRDGIVAALRDIGFHYVTLDLSGFRSGSMNEVLGATWTKRIEPTACDTRTAPGLCRPRL